jgi:hypothetical protein
MSCFVIAVFTLIIHCCCRRRGGGTDTDTNHRGAEGRC